MLKKVNGEISHEGAEVRIKDASFPAPFVSGLEYASPARGMWNIVHTGMLIPEAHEIFVCAASCLRGVVLTAAEMGAQERFSTVEIKEHNLLNGDMEELLIEGVCDIIEKLSNRPPVVLVYTSCVHHFAGCDLGMMYQELRERHPDITFIDCYMNPIMRKSGMTPDQLMRSRLYMPLKQRKQKKEAVAIIGNDLPMMKENDLYRFLEESGFKIHEITSCKTYEEYQEMAESSVYISSYPSAVMGGDMLEERLGGKHFYLPLSYDYDVIEQKMKELAGILGVSEPDFSGKREACEQAKKEAKELIGDMPIAIDYTFCPKPLGLARMLLEAGFRVEKVYLDAMIGEEKEDFLFLQKHYPDLLLYPTVHAKMRFMASREEGNVLAIGQKAAHFNNTKHFVNVVEGGGMLGFQAITQTLAYMKEAYLEEKDMRNLIQIKGMGCGGCQ